MKKNDRFERVYQQGKLTTAEIWVDLETAICISVRVMAAV